MSQQITIGIHVENSYASGHVFAHDREVVVDEPEAGADAQALDDWANDNLLDFTGEGGVFADMEGLYEVTVTKSEQRPELVGLEIGAQG